jgi:ribosome production factor 1
MREFDPSFLTANPASQDESNEPSTSTGKTQQDEIAADLENDPFASYFSNPDPTTPPKVLITTSPKSSKSTYEFCDELVGVFPGAEFIRRKKGKGFEMGRIASWAANRGYKHMCVVNENFKKPSECHHLTSLTVLLIITPDAITLIHLPNGPTAYFKLSSVQCSKEIHVRFGCLFPSVYV